MMARVNPFLCLEIRRKEDRRFLLGEERVKSLVRFFEVFCRFSRSFSLFLDVFEDFFKVS